MTMHDARKGKYWKPPLMTEIDQIPVEIRNNWESANQVLAQLLDPLIGQFSTKIKTLYSYGSEKQFTAKGEHGDGLSLLFALVTLSSPNTSDYRDEIEQRVMNQHVLFRNGNPITAIEECRKDLLEAIRLNIKVKWSVGRKVIDTISTRHQYFNSQLFGMKETCPDQEDSATQMDALYTKIEDGCNTLTTTNGELWYHAAISTTVADQAQSVKVQAKPVRKAGTPKLPEKCKFGPSCTRGDKHTKM